MNELVVKTQLTRVKNLINQDLNFCPDYDLNCYCLYTVLEVVIYSTVRFCLSTRKSKVNSDKPFPSTTAFQAP